jgi:hypothetical protein
MSHATAPKLTAVQQHLLQTLFEEGGLNTHLIAQYVLPALSRRQVGKELVLLRDQGWVRSQALGTDEGSEYCWVITYAGAGALQRAVVHTDTRYRVPSTIQLAQKALRLRLAVTLQTLNWAYLAPQPYNSSHPKPVETPQRQALVAAVAAHFSRTLPGAGVARLHPSQVPAGVNDWVAWPAEQAHKAIVVILHPVAGTQHFWREGTLKQRGRPSRERAPARTRLYADLARILPVIGVFATAELAADYGPLLERAQLRAYMLDEMAVFLHNHRVSEPGRGGANL